MSKQKRKSNRVPWRPYKLTYAEHVDLRRRKAGGQKVAELAVRFAIDPDTVQRYLKLNPETRHDAPGKP
jgi:hypothetical protein